MITMLLIFFRKLAQLIYFISIGQKIICVYLYQHFWRILIVAPFTSSTKCSKLPNFHQSNLHVHLKGCKSRKIKCRVHWDWNSWNLSIICKDMAIFPNSTSNLIKIASRTPYVRTWPVEKKLISQFACTYYLGLFLRVHSTILSSRTLDVVPVERI